MGQTHYGSCDRANESDNTSYWSDTICGLKEAEVDMTDNIDHVTCKNCLRVFNKIRKPNRKVEKVYPEIF